MTKSLIVAIAALLLALGVCGLLLKNAWSANGALETANLNQKAIIDQREADMKENARVIGQLSQKLNDTETKVVTTERVIYAAPKTTACVGQPSIGIALGGLRDIYAPALPAADRRQPTAAVPATGAPVVIAK